MESSIVDNDILLMKMITKNINGSISNIARQRISYSESINEAMWTSAGKKINLRDWKQEQPQCSTPQIALTIDHTLATLSSAEPNNVLFAWDVIE